jgi:hypothetical protein
MNFPNCTRKVILRLTTIVAMQAVLVLALLAQSGTTGISGTVSDQTGAAVPGATLTITNPETGFTRTTVSSGDGKYNFPGIPAATYRLEVTASNFKKSVDNNVKALVDKPLDLNIALQAGDVSAVVDVTSGNIESLVNTQDASLGNNFEPLQITQLPTDLRRVADLLSLQPGVTREGYVAGARSDQSNVVLDGVDINDQQTGGRTDQFQTTQDTVLRSTAESVEEFRITTTNANANQGRSSGAQISLITKSGTNDFRGSLFYFYRPTAFSANNFFNNAAGRERPSIARDVFGGSIGGPIIKDRFHFFYTYEGQTQKQEASVVRLVPLPHIGQGTIHFRGTGPSCVNGICSVAINELRNNIFPLAGINQTVVSLLAGVTQRYAANDTSVGDSLNTGGFRFNSPTTTKENTHIARFDYKLNNKQSLFARFNKQFDTITGTSQFPDTPSTATWLHPYGFVVGHDWAISNNKVNNIRYGFTRQAFSTQGDSSDPTMSFRFVYSPRLYARTLSRVTPTQNITDDFTWIKGSHTFQLGGNVRIIRNTRVDFANAFDTAITNPSWYDLSGDVLTNAFSDAGYNIDAGDIASVQAVSAALIGRLDDYTGSFNFDIDGSVLPAGSPSDRKFATEEYDVYFQDSWKVRSSLTLAIGLRYSLGRPVYEAKGFQVVPKERLGNFFERRRQSAAMGIPMNDLIDFEKAGPVNDGQGFYSMDWNNLQPRIAAAWSPNFKSGFLKTLFGKDNASVIRGGFAIVNDHFGEQLAVSFDNLSLVGFTSSNTINANTYDVDSNLAPPFTGFNQDIRSFPGIPPPQQRFSIDVPSECISGEEECSGAIEYALDGTIKTPTHYTWNVSYGRRLPKGLYVEASYIGRRARNLLATRDVMALNNIVDPNSGMDTYTAFGLLINARNANVPVTSLAPIPYFEYFFPNIAAGNRLNSTQEIYRQLARARVNNDPNGAPLGGRNITDYTTVQLIIDDWGRFPNLYYHPQFGAYSAFSSTAYSNYDGATISIRQRLGQSLTYDLNYTYAISKDNASGLQTGGSYGSQFILNSLRPDDNYAYSDFDTRHNINANFVLQLPFGRGQHFFSDVNKPTQVILGGWQFTGIYRWNSGLPISVPFDAQQWATNWNAQSNGTRTGPIAICNNRSTQNIFCDPSAAFKNFRNAIPGETGERNVFRLPGYSTLDLGLSKSFGMPWGESHKLQVRWEVFNVFNYQYLNGDNATRSSYGLPRDPGISPTSRPASDFGKIFTSIQGAPRRMQFGVRYSF